MATCPTCRARYSDDVKSCAADGEALLPDEAVAAADGDLEPGVTVGEYRVEAKIGEGGFGAVYRAVHPLIGKTAAIKVLNKQYSSNPQMVSRFIAEARAVNQIRNRNIIDIFSFGALDDGRQYYVMELLEGATMDAYLRKKGPLSPEEALPILLRVARALDAAHAAGIAHRDLKPENVFLVFDEDGGVLPKLLDFGIAKLLGDSIAGHKTRTGTPMGTPHYMSPEQCRGRNVDHRTDVYSFGVMTFEVLTGKVPFDGEDVMEILVKHTTAPAPRASEVLASLSPALDAPLMAFLEKEPASRPASASAGLDALAAAAAAAGFDVKVSTKKPGDVPARAGAPEVRVGGGATPTGGLVEAPTMMADDVGSAKTILSAEAAPKPAGGRTVVYGAAAAAVLAAAIGIGVTLRPKEGATPSPGATPVTAAVTATAPTPAAPPSVTPSATAGPVDDPRATAPAEVELRFDATPPVVDVYLGPTKIGTSAAPVRVKRADGTVKLTFKAPGYVTQDVDVPASASGATTVTLKKVASGGGKKKGELEF